MDRADEIVVDACPYCGDMLKERKGLREKNGRLYPAKIRFCLSCRFESVTDASYSDYLKGLRAAFAK